jgi:acid phosphatase family membrane protein YuiD
MTIYLILPLFTWLVTGSSKFLINSAKEKRLAFDLIGYGGMPSNHSAIVSSITTLVALKEGINSASFGIALSFSFIVLLDASSLRQQISKHAIQINRLSVSEDPLRDRIGHTKLEILTGLIMGSACAFTLKEFFDFL